MDKHTKKILIIEDDGRVSKVYETKFIQEGYIPVLVESGEHATKKIVHEKPDLIILDLMVPKKDGFAILKEIKGNSIIANIPIIVLTNLGGRDDHERALGLGANDYMVKSENSIQHIVDNIKKYV